MNADDAGQARARTLREWLAYIETLHPSAIAMGLDRVAAVAARMRLRIDCPVVTVGGTNGKGSTSAMIETIYRRAGYRTGLYASPHLRRYNERVRIAGVEASDEALASAFARVEAARSPHPPRVLSPPSSLTEQARGEISLTYFEFGTLAALSLYADAKLDVLILEVGLGGRLDAVNIVDADVAVVTTIDIDHAEWLGDTREAIGREKAGIFRRGRIAVCGDPDPPHSLVAYAAEIGAPLWRLGCDFRYAGEGTQWRYEGPGGPRYGLPYPALRGAYQLQNAATALAAIDALRDRLHVPGGAVREGLVHVALPGRLQVLPGQPAIVVDVAHNPQAARVLAQALGAMGNARRTLAVFGMLKDKDVEAVVRTLAPRIDAWYVAALPGPRGADVSRLHTALVAAGVAESAIHAFTDIAHALADARRDAGDTDRIAAFGSFLTAAAVLDAAEPPHQEQARRPETAPTRSSQGC
jgi:dihydrofolate synthase/folylpolyglutamate synthase